jgi:hypothetical protein
MLRGAERIGEAAVNGSTSVGGENRNASVVDEGGGGDKGLDGDGGIGGCTEARESGSDNAMAGLGWFVGQSPLLAITLVALVVQALKPGLESPLLLDVEDGFVARDMPLYPTNTSTLLERVAYEFHTNGAAVALATTAATITVAATVVAVRMLGLEDPMFLLTCITEAVVVFWCALAWLATAEASPLLYEPTPTARHPHLDSLPIFQTGYVYADMAYAPAPSD